jgi:hypothetical protein
MGLIIKPLSMLKLRPLMQVKTFLSAVVLLAVLSSTRGRLMEDTTYAEMFDKADLVVIAKPVSTKDTSEHTMLLGNIRVVGVNTDFETRFVLKGEKSIRKFVLHHYRLTHRHEPIVNGPDLAVFNLKEPKAFLMFLTKQADGRYAPASGQIDPAAFSILELKRSAE